MVSTVARHRRLGWVAGAVAIYLLLAVPLAVLFEPAVGTVSILPVVVAASFFGWRGGLALAALCLCLDTLLLNIGGVPGWGALLRYGDGLAALALPTLGLTVGALRDLSVRTVAETTRREHDERFRLLAESASDLLFRYRLAPRRGFDYVSPSATTISGYTPEEYYADPDLLLSLVHPDDRERFLATFRELWRSGAAGGGALPEVPFRGYRKDGRLIWCEPRVILLRDGTGDVVAVEGVVRDVTARMEAEAALRASEAELAEAQRIAHLGSWTYDRRSPTLTWSDETFRILGHPPRSFAPTYEQFLAQVHPDDLPAVERAVATSIATGAEYRLELRVIRPDGTIRQLQALGESHLVGGRLDRLVGIVLDVTERRAAALALREEEDRSRTLSAAADRQARDLALLDRVRIALAREIDPAAVFRAIVESLATTFGHTRVGLYLLEGDVLIRQQLDGPDDQFPRVPIARGILGRVARTGRPALLEDVGSDPDFIAEAEGIVSEVCVPLLDGERVAGVLNLESVGGKRLGEADLRLMIALSEQIGIAIGRARLYAEARANAESLAAAQRIAHLGSWEFDIAREELRCSDEIFRIGGANPQEFVPTLESMLDIVHADDRERISGAMLALMERGEPYDLDHRLVRPDGEIRTVHQQVEVVHDAAGRPRKYVGIMQDVTARRALEARLLHQSFHDPLTGLPNRALFLDRLDYALARARRGGAAGTVLFLDLDRFKDINDTLGHDEGDRLLVLVAARLRRYLRDEDTLARMGGDEFAILLEGSADPGTAARLAERLASALDQPLSVGAQEHRVTASVGIVLIERHYDRAEAVLRDADVAMYRAKEAGKARYAVFDPAMQTAVQDRLALEQDLRRALAREEFVLHYQPIVDLRTGRTRAVESLVRWQQPERGLVSPALFLPLAEETGLIRTLGRWVLREACRQARAWQEVGLAVTVAVNLTAREFQSPDLVGDVAAALRAADLAPRWLSLEITEGAAMGDAPATVATLAALRELGVGLVIDDFGTGYSSLAYLQRFPVDALKIDKAFVDGLGTEAEDTAIVEAIVTLARTLGLDVVAEGVETAAQAARLAALGCPLGQGYHFARPQPPAVLPALLARTWSLPVLQATLDD